MDFQPPLVTKNRLYIMSTVRFGTEDLDRAVARWKVRRWPKRIETIWFVPGGHKEIYEALKANLPPARSLRRFANRNDVSLGALVDVALERGSIVFGEAPVLTAKALPEFEGEAYGPR